MKLLRESYYISFITLQPDYIPLIIIKKKKINVTRVFLQFCKNFTLAVEKTTKLLVKKLHTQTFSVNGNKFS